VKEHWFGRLNRIAWQLCSQQNALPRDRRLKRQGHYWSGTPALRAKMDRLDRIFMRFLGYKPLRNGFGGYFSNYVGYASFG
jgi:hypothetical protein